MAANRRSEDINYRHFISVGEEMKGVSRCKQTFVEALDIVCERDVLFPKEAFIRAVAECLHGNGVIKEPTLFEVCRLDSNIMAKFGRNYRMKDLLDAVASFYMIREVFPRTSLELVKNVHSA